MDVSYEYVLSGMSHTRIVAKRACHSDTIRPIVKKMVDDCQTRLPHDFSMLFNAATERQFGQFIRAYGFDDVSVHADSGGLQIITQGLDLDEAKRREIYDVQCKWSDVAMSFDDIPLIIDGKSSRTSTNTKTFDHEGFAAKAKTSGQNLREQLEHFANKDSKSKVFAIIHGNCLDTYREWLDLLLKEVPEDLYPFIGGIASGSGALGTAELEDIERAFSLSVLDVPDGIPNHFHVLGVGALKKMAPFIGFANGGIYGDAHISYDSTTLTSSLTFGNVFFENKLHRLPKKPSPFGAKIYEEMRHLGVHDVIGYADFLHALVLNFEDYKKTHSCDQVGFEEAYITARLGAVLLQMEHFVSAFERLRTGEDPMPTSMAHLGDIKTVDDFNHWYKNVGSRLSSNRIKTPPQTLGAFFA